MQLREVSATCRRAEQQLQAKEEVCVEGEGGRGGGGGGGARRYGVALCSILYQRHCRILLASAPGSLPSFFFRTVNQSRAVEPGNKATVLRTVPWD